MEDNEREKIEDWVWIGDPFRVGWFFDVVRSIFLDGRPLPTFHVCQSAWAGTTHKNKNIGG